uniref:Uncharacterized protein n=1 Tax=Arundo donax TaxID=35708 RepID=A0A0A9CDE8_ARUDO
MAYIIDLTLHLCLVAINIASTGCLN